MKISVVIASHDEERDLETTIACAWSSDPPAHEIIVVDDASSISVQSRVGSFPGVKVVRSDEQLGAGPAKRLGAEHSSGDVVVILDSHMRMPLDWLAHIEATVREFPRSIFCTVCRGFENLSKFIGAGAEFTRADDLFMGRRWLKPGSPGVTDRCPCLLGACYIVPKKIWNELGGINPNLIGWGYGEQDLSIRAWLQGFEVRRINSLMVLHRFNRKLSPGNRMNTWHNGYNALVTAATVFEDGAFERLYSPYLRQAYRPEAWERFQKNRDEIRAFREFVQARRAYSDDELHGLCNFRHPTPSEQQRKLDEILRSRAVPKFERETKSRPAMGERHLETILSAIPENGNMLEWGAGFGTIWLRERLKPGQSLTSIEHDPRWAKRVGGCVLHEMGIVPGQVEAESLPGEKSLCLDQSVPYVACKGHEGPYDVILIDGVLRNACLLRATCLLRPGGSLFLHDAQRDWYDIGREAWSWSNRDGSCSDYPGPELWRSRAPRAPVAFRASAPDPEYAEI